jgi:hypothetical protein
VIADRLLRRLYARLFGGQHERDCLAVLADDRDDGELLPRGWFDQFAEKMGWPSGHLVFAADGTLKFVPDACGLASPAVPLAHEADPNRSGDECASELREDRQGAAVLAASKQG